MKLALTSSLVLIIWVVVSDALLIATFNIQTFGRRKMETPGMAAILVNITRRYDMIFIQEIRDQSNYAFPALVIRLRGETSRSYEYILSNRLGRSNNREQFGCIYDSSKVYPGDRYYSSDHTYFERPPFSLIFRLPDNRQFVFTNVHLKPSAVRQEAEQLYREIEQSYGRHGIPNFILGDMNAAGYYLRTSEKENLQLWRDPSYKWLVPDSLDTTVARRGYAYDRIIAKNVSTRHYNLNSVKIYRFDEELVLNRRMARQVSDHYPVEFELL